MSSCGALSEKGFFRRFPGRLLGDERTMKQVSIFRLALKQFTLIFGSVCLLTGSGLSIASGILLWVNSRYAAQGILADARVTGLTTTRGSKSSTIYYVAYEFRTPDGKSFGSRSQVDQEIFAKLKEGDAIMVQYVRSDPDENRIPQDSDQFLPWVLLGIGALCGLPGLGLSVYGALRVRRSWKVIQNGERAQALVTAVLESTMRVNRVRQWHVLYQYTDYAGKTHEGRSDYMPPAEAEQWKEGSRGWVRFDREAPDQSYWMGRES